MLKNRKNYWVLSVCFGLLAVGFSATGCGDNRPKIVRPDNPSPIPDESMKLHIDSSHAPSPGQDEEKSGGGK